MEIFALGAAALFLAFAAFFFFENSKLHKRIVALDEQLREAQLRKSKPSKSDKSETKSKTETATVSADPELERDLDDARAEIKDLKKTVYDLKKGSKQLKEQVKENEDRPSVPDSNVMFSLREELAEVKAENSRLEEKIKASKTSPRPEPPAPKPKAKDPEPTAAASSDSTGSEVEALKSKYHKELDTLRGEVKDLERRLKSTASNVDKQRRRADNNDRAYKITQRQYDAAQERVGLLEEQLQKSEFAAPTEQAEQPSKTAATPPKLKLPKKNAPPTTPSSGITKKARKPEVGSTTVLSSMALASASTAAPSESEAEESTTVHRAKPIVAADLDVEPPTPEPVSEPMSEPEADESGGHTAVLTPGALAASLPQIDDEKSEPAADESGGHTAVLSAASLSKAVTGETSAPDAVEQDEEMETVEAPRDTGERTAVLTPAAFAPAEPKPEPEEGRRPSAGLFGMPADVFDRPAEEEEDAVRSTQFAFPTQMDREDDSSGTARFAPVANAELKPASRLGGSVSEGENPADKPVPDATTGEGESSDEKSRPGGRLGALDLAELGDIDSAIDDAWGDIDID